MVVAELYRRGKDTQHSRKLCNESVRSGFFRLLVPALSDKCPGEGGTQTFISVHYTDSLILNKGAGRMLIFL